MAHEVYIRVLINGTTTDYYLSGRHTPYTGSGTPWTAQATSPYEIDMGSGGQHWTPQPAPALPIWSGGPPFRSGRTLIGRNYDTIQQTIPIKCRGTSHNFAVEILQNLRRVLSIALTQTPPILAVKPDGSTNTVYYEIYDAQIVEDATFINTEKAHSLVRANLTLICSPFGGLLTTPETLINGASLTNRGTSSPDDVESLGSSASGDLIYEGSPLNIEVHPVNDSSVDVTRVIYLAAVHERQYTTTGSTSTVTTSSTTGVALNSTGIPLDATSALTRVGLKPRFLPHFTSFSGAAEVQVQVRYAGSTITIYTSPWFSYPLPPGELYVAAAIMVDMGTWPLDAVRRARNLDDPRLELFIRVRSSTGASVTVTQASSEILLYYTFCRTEDTFSGSGGGIALTQYLLVDTFQEQSGGVCLPYVPRAHVVNESNDRVARPVVLIGEPPKFFAGASLWCTWLSGADGVTGEGTMRDTASTATITVTHAPLFRTLRGYD